MQLVPAFGAGTQGRVGYAVGCEPVHTSPIAVVGSTTAAGFTGQGENLLRYLGDRRFGLKIGPGSRWSAVQPIVVCTKSYSSVVPVTGGTVAAWAHDT